MSNSIDAIVAGAGVWGCTIARRLADAGQRVLVLEKRKAVGGNCRCRTENGIEVHIYGSHIFHTSNEEVWQFVNRFCTFNSYRHCVLAKTKKCGDKKVGGESRSTVDGFRLYHLPIGKTLLEEFFGVSMKERTLKEFLDEPIDPSTVNLQPPTSTSTRREAIFDAFIRGYTSKQWGVPPEKVDPSIIARLKVRDTYSTDYFDDPHQGIPRDGYNALFERMLDHPNITVKTGCSLRLKPGEVISKPREGRAPSRPRPRQSAALPRGNEVFEIASGDRGFEITDEKTKSSRPLFDFDSHLRLFYSGPIDQLFHSRFGHLPWRSLRFETENLCLRDFQGGAVVNYTDAAIPFTRIHEFRHYHPEADGPFAKPRGTIIMREYPADWKPGDEPYYPIDTPESRALLARYQALAATIPNLTIGGRLGEYKYYDMDKSIAAALQVPTV